MDKNIIYIRRSMFDWKKKNRNSILFPNLKNTDVKSMFGINEMKGKFFK